MADVPPKASPPLALPPKLTVTDIFKTHEKAYLAKYPVTHVQYKAIQDMVACRTAKMGGHLYQCQACGSEQPLYNGCLNRHCPTCQSTHQAIWIVKQQKRLLKTPYFHVVFTVPHECQALFLHNQKPMYDLLFRAASQTLLSLGQDPKHLGGHVGFTAVLHTWTRCLEYHPHVHCIVTGGGLSQNTWIASSETFLFPVTVMSSLFRGKFLDGLCKCVNLGQLKSHKASCAVVKDPKAFQELLTKLYGMPWVVYCKKPFGGPSQIFRYLGRYTHRVGISNERLISVTMDSICFYTKNGQQHSLPPLEFMRRFLLHILPSGFVKIRHYGLMAPGNLKTKWILAHGLLSPDAIELPMYIVIGVITLVLLACMRACMNAHDLAHIFKGSSTMRRCPMCGQCAMVKTMRLPPCRDKNTPALKRDTS